MSVERSDWVTVWGVGGAGELIKDISYIYSGGCWRGDIRYILGGCWRGD